MLIYTGAPAAIVFTNSDDIVSDLSVQDKFQGTTGAEDNRGGASIGVHKDKIQVEGNIDDGIVIVAAKRGVAFAQGVNANAFVEEYDDKGD